jgi:hypothetical protein
MKISDNIHFVIGKFAIDVTDSYYTVEAKERTYETFKRDIDYLKQAIEKQYGDGSWEMKFLLDGERAGNQLYNKFILESV